MGAVSIIYKEDWDSAKKRFDAFWKGEILDRCVIGVLAPRDKPFDSKNMRNEAGDFLQQWTDSEFRMEKLICECSRTFFGGEAYPSFWNNVGPGIVAGFLGSAPVFDNTTVWYDRDPIIKEWGNKPGFKFNDNNGIWNTIKKMTEYFGKSSNSNYLTGFTDLGGVLDIAASLRGTENLLFDLFDAPDEVKALAGEIDILWELYYSRLAEIISQYQEGYTTWMQLWCRERYYCLQCDFSSMISPEQFKEFVMPSLYRHTKFLDKSIYHMDGMGEIPHIEHLLDIKELTGIQWEPGAGNPGPGNECWLPMYKRIQERGKNIVLLGVEPKQVEKLLQELSPKGIYMRVRCQSEDESKELLKNAEKWSCKQRG
ncbi:MAG: hypothetical protein M0R40_09015 [Firmicutes bacterium]|nr:hypothetical protein [Bacillota bacterium]